MSIIKLMDVFVVLRGGQFARIRQYIQFMINTFRVNPDHKDADLLPILESFDLKSYLKWSDDEIVRLGEGIKRYGKNWYKVSTTVGTKSRFSCQ